MSKYEALTEHLKAQRVDRVRMSFADIERVLGRALPPSAASHRAWWSNNPSNNVMTRSWLAAGFRSEQVDLPARRLVFRRAAPIPGRPMTELNGTGATSSTQQTEKSALFGWLRGALSTHADTDLTKPADPDWGRLGE